MSGDVHVQFCERPGVRFPRATHLVILCQGPAAEALAVVRRWMQALKLTLNETKTRTCDATQVHFDFLGYTFGPMVHRPTGRTYVGAQPSRRAMARLRERVRGILRPGNQAPWPEVVRQVNRVVGGWQRYFSYGDGEPGVLEPGQVPAVPRPWLPDASAQAPWARDAALHSGTGLRPRRPVLFGRSASCSPVACLAVKPVREPCAGKRPARFDERSQETGYGRWD